MSLINDAVFKNEKFLKFLLDHKNECVNVTVWAAFGYKNYAERDALELLRLYNEKGVK